MRRWIILLIARNNKGQLVLASKACKSLKYSCPSCGQGLILKQGVIKQAHFSHSAKSSCHSFSEGETEEHLAGKEQLFDWLNGAYKRVKLEAYLPDIQQRPDLYMESLEGDQICLEFQCSPIPSSQVIQRSQTYIDHGYQVVWILGEKLWLKAGWITNLQKLFMTSLKGNYLALLELDTGLKSINIVHDIRQTGHLKLGFKRRKFPLTHVGHADFLSFQQRSQNHQIRRYNLYHIHEMVVKQLRRGNSKYHDFAQLMYKEGQNILTVCHHIYQPVDYEWIFQGLPLVWKLNILLQLSYLQPGEEFDFSSLIDVLGVKTYAMPLVSDTFFHVPIRSFLTYLTDQDILLPLNRERYQLLKPIKHFSSEHEKIHYLRKLA